MGNGGGPCMESSRVYPNRIEDFIANQVVSRGLDERTARAYRMDLENTEPYQLDKPVQFFTKQHNLDLCKVSGFNIGMIRAFKKSPDSEFIVYDPIDYSSWTFEEFPDKV